MKTTAERIRKFPNECLFNNGNNSTPYFFHISLREQISAPGRQSDSDTPFLSTSPPNGSGLTSQSFSALSMSFSMPSPILSPSIDLKSYFSALCPVPEGIPASIGIPVARSGDTEPQDGPPLSPAKRNPTTRTQSMRRINELARHGGSDLHGSMTVKKRSSSADRTGRISPRHLHESLNLSRQATSARPTFAQPKPVKCRGVPAVSSEPQSPPLPPTTPEPRQEVVAMFDYTATSSHVHSFKAGAILLLTKRRTEEWAEGIYNGALGVFPLPYVRFLSEDPNQKVAITSSDDSLTLTPMSDGEDVLQSLSETTITPETTQAAGQPTARETRLQLPSVPPPHPPPRRSRPQPTVARAPPEDPNALVLTDTTPPKAIHRWLDSLDSPDSSTSTFRSRFRPWSITRSTSTASRSHLLSVSQSAVPQSSRPDPRPAPRISSGSPRSAHGSASPPGDTSEVFRFAALDGCSVRFVRPMCPISQAFQLQAASPNRMVEWLLL